MLLNCLLAMVLKNDVRPEPKGRQSKGDFKMAMARKSLDEISQKLSVSVWNIPVDYGRSLEDGVIAGNYDYVSREINSQKFPKEKGMLGIIDVGISLLLFNEITTSRTVLEGTSQMGLIPGGIHELLALSEKYPGLQKEFSIIGFGHDFYWKESKFVPMLGFSEPERRFLSISWSGHRFEKDKRFIAIDKFR